MKIVLFISVLFLAAFDVSAQVSPACSQIIVAGPSSLTAPGETMTFTANVDSALSASSKLEWTVSAGTIESGQGTSSISVRVPSDGNVDRMKAYVKIVGSSTECNETFTLEAPVAPRLFVCGLPPDDYPKLPRNEEKARLANLAYMWKTVQGTALVFVVYLAPKEDIASARRRVRFIRDFYQKDRISTQFHVPSDSLKLLFANSDHTHTLVYMIPPQDIASFAKSFELTEKIEEIRPINK